MRRFYVVTTTKSRNVKNGNGVTTVFPFDFVYQDAADIVVTLIDAAGVQTVKTLTTDYTLSGGSGATGSVTTTSFTPATGEQLVIERQRDFTQESDYVARDQLPAEVIELDFDKAVMLVQQLKDIVERSVRLPITSDPDNPPELTVPTPVSGQILVGKSDASGWDNANAATLGAVALPLTVADGGTGATTATAALTNLGLSANGKSLVTAADFAAMRTLLSLVVGTNVQAFNAALASLATLGASLANGDILYATAANTLARLAAGTDGHALKLASGIPAWAQIAGGPETFDSTSGTSFTFSVPATARLIMIAFGASSLSGTDHYLLRPVTTVGEITTGYASNALIHIASSTHSAAISSTAGFVIPVGAAALGQHGIALFSKLDDSPHSWTCSANGGYAGSSSTWQGGGSVQVDDPLTGIKVLASGADTFDSGRITCVYI